MDINDDSISQIYSCLHLRASCFWNQAREPWHDIR